MTKKEGGNGLPPTDKSVGKKIRWYHWLNPFFYINMIVLAHLQRAVSNLCYNVMEEVKDKIR